MENRKLRVGVIGTGNIARSHLNAYKNNPDVEIYALCDIDPQHLEKAGKEYGVTRLYTDRAQMLALPELDAVSVCTWNSAHAVCTIDALNAGKNVICEKPMATNAEDALAMQRAAEKNGKLLMIGFVRRFGDDMALIRDFADKGYFGDFYYAKAQYLRRNGNPGGWFGDKSRSGGGPLIDLGVHVIDFVRYAMGNPKATSVYGATYQKLFDRKNIKTPKAYVSHSATDHDICDVEDLAVAMIRFDNGATLTIEASFSLNTAQDSGDLQLYGDKAGVIVGSPMRLFSEENGYMTDVTLAGSRGFDFTKSFQAEIDDFVHSVRTGEPCRNPAEDGVELMRILTAIYESAASGHEVTLA